MICETRSKSGTCRASGLVVQSLEMAPMTSPLSMYDMAFCKDAVFDGLVGAVTIIGQIMMCGHMFVEGCASAGNAESRPAIISVKPNFFIFSIPFLTEFSIFQCG